MDTRISRTRRVSGRSIAAIAITSCLIGAPAAVYAADRMLSVIADPYNSSALVRVSEDGRLGVRGETSSQQGLPANEWHNRGNFNYATTFLLKDAPPGQGIGISQITLASIGVAPEVGWARVNFHGAAAEKGICVPHLEPGRESEIIYTAVLEVPETAPGRTRFDISRSRQFVFPVPLTLPATDNGACLYARIDTDGHRLIGVFASGVSGPATPTFNPPEPDGPATEAPPSE